MASTQGSGGHGRGDERHDPPCLPVAEEGDEGVGWPLLARWAKWPRRLSFCFNFCLALSFFLFFFSDLILFPKLF